MKLSLLHAAALTFVALGCGRTATVTSAANSSAITAGEPRVAHEALAGHHPKTSPGDAPNVPSTFVNRRVGDYVVFKFTGTFRKGALTLIEKIVAKEGTILVVDYTLVETGAKGVTKEHTLRVKMDQKIGGRGEIFGVQKLENGQHVEGTLEDFEALMAKTVVVADANDETIGSEDITVDVAGKALAAQKTSYKVKIGKKAATMTITQSDAFLWGDLAGEIVSADGTVVYRAELVDSGSAPALPREGGAAKMVASDED